jgi:uncharacterized protein (TIGR02266 family)
MADTSRSWKRRRAGNAWRAHRAGRVAGRSRTALVFHGVEVDCGDQETFLFTYLRNPEATGIFVRTTSPREPGTAVSLRFQPDHAAQPLALDGHVIWINPYRPADASHVSPGMGIRFFDLTFAERAHLFGLVKRLALLVDDGLDACEHA